MTEIFATLGPACADSRILDNMLFNGMTGIRLNLSHTTLRAALPEVELVRAAAARHPVHLDLLLDMQGPELRLGRMEPRDLVPGETVLLEELPLPEIVPAGLEKGQLLLLDDGKIALTLVGGATDGLPARVDRGGRLTGRKSLALPGLDIRPPAVTAEDRENLALAGAAGVSGIMQPFVRGPEDLREIRAAMEAAGCGALRLLAKIENQAGVEQLPELLPLADMIVIARGDLGNAVPLWDLPGVQKDIAKQCLAAGKPFMVVTQMLSSMETSPVPTRAEISDIFNAVLDGASAVMLTGETAVGRYPAEAVGYLSRTARAARVWRQARRPR